MEPLVTALCAQLTTITHTLSTWMHADSPTLAQVEQHVLPLLKEVGMALVTGLCQLAVPAQPDPTVPCVCGQSARYVRLRPAQVTTLLGPITLHRPYYHCAACGQGQHPLDAHLQICAGSRSAGLDEMLALLGATQDSFAEAARVLERLTLVHVSPNSVRDATEHLGAVLLAEQAQHATAAQAGHARPPATPSPERLYIAMDGVLAHLHHQGWSELKVGCCYQTHTRPQLRRPARMDIRAHHARYVTALTDAETVGWQLWQEAARRGVVEATEVVVLGDGAHWIWTIADLHFPRATQIVDWYHASQYLWNAAAAIWGEASPQRIGWAQDRLDELWDGQVAVVRAALEPYRAAGDAVVAALSYSTTHQTRMDYASYRARGLQIGSGSVESACKQLVRARLKQAGMIWNAPGAEAVATVRAWLKGDRWREAMALRPTLRRGYQRQQPREAQRGITAPAAHAAPPAMVSPPEAVPHPTGLSPEVLAQVRAALARAPAQHPWRKPWSKRQQRAQHTEQPGASGTIATA